MRDVGLVTSDEPFTQLLTQGMVLKDGSKMSKSKGNTVDPQPLLERYGADTVRLFMMFAAPPEQSLEWSDAGVAGAHRFLKRLWHAAHLETKLPIHDTDGKLLLSTEAKRIRREYHQLLKQMNADYQRQQFNTVVSGCMKLLNTLETIPADVDSKERAYLLSEGFSLILRLLAPITPHISDYLWQQLGFGENINQSAWPVVDESALVSDTQQLIVQINGKLRGKVHVATETNKDAVTEIVLAMPELAKFLEQKTVEKVIVIPGKLVNVVVKDV
jgi:leucyl-tRNA synthetase